MPVVAFEGLDGSGKSTQCRLLSERLGSAGMGAAIRPLFRFDIVEEMLEDLDGAAEVPDVGSRYAVMAKVLTRQEWVVNPRLGEREATIYDKFLLTFLANEIVRGADRHELEVMSRRVLPPSLTFVLEISPETALRRKGGKVGFREAGLNLATYRGEPVTYSAYKAGLYPAKFLEQRYVEFQLEVQAAMRSLIDADKSPSPFGRRCVLLKAERSTEDLAAEIWSHVDESARAR
ncbi:dTMP kinase [Streptomyces sp. NPDC021224]|uniref:dTMP kinase n=1 Tax=Streptomyces sp. NPDC021224 TaxID=3365120 RepID=UPI0037B8E596